MRVWARERQETEEQQFGLNPKCLTAYVLNPSPGVLEVAETFIGSQFVGEGLRR